jgi:hypothetical protein
MRSSRSRWRTRGWVKLSNSTSSGSPRRYERPPDRQAIRRTNGRRRLDAFWEAHLAVGVDGLWHGNPGVVGRHAAGNELIINDLRVPFQAFVVRIGRGRDQIRDALDRDHVAVL